jgi:hypothetical protein
MAVFIHAVVNAVINLPFLVMPVVKRHETTCNKNNVMRPSAATFLQISYFVIPAFHRTFDPGCLFNIRLETAW